MHRQLTSTNPTGARRSRRVVAASIVAAAAVALGACSSDKELTTGTDVSTTSVDSSTTIPASTTTVPVVAETTVPVPAETLPPVTVPPPPVTEAPPLDLCTSDFEMPADAQSVSTAVGDYDGDGVEDVATAWAEDTGSGFEWFFRFEIDGYPFGSTIELGDLGVGYLEILSTFDLDYSLGVDPGVNRDEVIAIVGSSPSGVQIGYFGVNENYCAFQFDNGSDGYYTTFVGGSIAQLGGLTCDATAGSRFLVVTAATTSDNGETYATFDYKLERLGSQSLTLGGGGEGLATSEEMDFDRYTTAQCDGVVWF